MMKIYTYSADYDKKLGFWTPIKDCGKIFLVDENSNSIFIGSLKSKYDEIVLNVSKVISTDDYVYFFSKNRYELWRLKKADYSLEYNNYYPCNNLYVLNTVQVGNYALIYSNKYDHINQPIFKINLKSMSVEKMSLDHETLLNSKILTRFCVEDDNNVIFASRQPGDINIYALNITTQSFNVINVPNAMYVNCVTVFNNCYWVLYKGKNKKSIIEQISKNGESLNTYDVNNHLSLDDSLRLIVFAMIPHNNKLYLVHCDNNRVDTVSVSCNGQLQFECHVSEICNPLDSMVTINDFQICDDGLLLYSPNLGFFYKFLWESNSIVRLNLEINDHQWTEVMDEFFLSQRIIKESEIVTLSSFIDHL